MKGVEMAVRAERKGVAGCNAKITRRLAFRVGKNDERTEERRAIRERGGRLGGLVLDSHEEG
jgi:hypothetical protein